MTLPERIASGMSFRVMSWFSEAGKFESIAPGSSGKYPGLVAVAAICPLEPSARSRNSNCPSRSVKAACGPLICTRALGMGWPVMLLTTSPRMVRCGCELSSVWLQQLAGIKTSTMKRGKRAIVSETLMQVRWDHYTQIFFGRYAKRFVVSHDCIDESRDLEAARKSADCLT